MDDAVAQFMAITDQDATVAEGCLGMTEGDVMAAVNLFFENPDIASSFTTALHQPSAATAASASGAAAAPASSRSQGSSRPIGREDPAGVIHIDSDDEEEDIVIPDDHMGGADPDHADLQRIAQESDDAAMAQRLQEEMYGEGNAASDAVRAPIQRTTETLVAPSGYGVDPDDEFQAYDQLRHRARTTSKT